MAGIATEVHELHKSSQRPLVLRGLPDAAWDGDEEVFRRVVEGHGAALQSHCHRMLGTLHDAEDAFQETMLRAWRGLPGYQGRSSLRTWLHRIATNVCVDAIGRRRRREWPIEPERLTGPGREAPAELVRKPVSIEPYSDREIEAGAASPAARYEQRESLELAFVAALQHLPARQRAVLILRDVLGFSAKEVAVTLETTVAATNSALQRARAALDGRRHGSGEQAALRSLGDARVPDVVERLVDALDGGDVGAILVLLAEDPQFAMCPARSSGRARTRSRTRGQSARSMWAPPSCVRG